MRRRLGSDQREVQLRPTAQGRAVIALSPRPVHGVLMDALDTIPRQILESLDASLNEVIDAMKIHDNTGVMTASSENGRRDSVDVE